jgi:cellulose synthase/poly-beta-1,6-N-acetylglucosamine synthase-like glycosyltransferase
VRVMFWISAGLLLYTYCGYPMLLIALGSLRQIRSDLRFGLARRTRRASRDLAEWPRVSLVFAAHNEETVIAQKMRNCARLDYPADLLEKHGIAAIRVQEEPSGYPEHHSHGRSSLPDRADRPTASSRD